MAKKEEEKKDVKNEEKTEPSEQPIEYASPVDELEQPAKNAKKRTVKEIVEELTKNPRQEDFWCPAWSGFAVVIGKKYFKFANHHYLTSDPEEIEMLLSAPECNLHYFAMNPDLRNLKAK